MLYYKLAAICPAARLRVSQCTAVDFPSRYAGNLASGEFAEPKRRQRQDDLS